MPAIASFLLIVAILVIAMLFRRSRNEKNRTILLEQKLADIAEKNYQLLSEKNEIELQCFNFEQMLECATIPLWKRDERLELIFVNSYYSQVTEGNKGDEITSSTFELCNSSRHLAQQAQKTESIQTMRKHIVVAGDRRYYQITEIPSKDCGTVGLARDITDLEEVENELEQHISVQSNLLESSSSATAIYGADQRLQFFNQAFMQLWGLDEIFLSSKPTYGEILETLREKRMLPEQVDFKSFKKKNTQMFTSEVDNHDEIYYLPNGTILRRIAIAHENGGLLFLYEDLTDQYALERTYNTVISVNKQTLENLSEGVAVFREDGKLQLWNPVFIDMWQVDIEFLKNQPHISDLLESTKFLYEYGDDWKFFKQTMISIFNKRTKTDHKLELTNSSTLNWQAVPLPDGAMLMTYTDITASINAEKLLRAEKNALKEAHNIKASFLENVSYELRSPLTSIKGFSEVLLKKYFGELNNQQEEYAKGILDSAERLNGFINNILDISSIDTGYMTLEIDDFDIYDAMADVITEFKTSGKTDSVDIIFKCSPKIGKMLGDKKRIKQIVSNLLKNSLKFVSPDKGKITLNIKAKSTNIEISVKDNGKGILPEERSHIFKKFYKIQNDNFSGAGLGLALSKSFVELHGGNIDVKSDINKSTKITCIFKRKNKDLLKSKKEVIRDAA